MAEVSDTVALRIRGVGKSYGALQVLADITFDIGHRRVHALVGENGAGKSTLVKIITGIIPADSGQIMLDDRPVVFETPLEARAAGIAAVYQDPKLFPHLDIAENIFVGNYPRTPWGSVDRRTMYRRAADAFGQLGVTLDPQALVGSLSTAELQFVEIARALSTDVRLLILDEPTSPLTPVEAERLFNIMRRLRTQGKSVLFITHRLEEVAEIADDVTVLRDGRHIATRPIAKMDRAAMVNLMVGRELAHLFTRRRAKPRGDEILRVEGLGRRGTFVDVTFSVHAGEIVGMAGLVGAGRSEIAQALFGMAPPDTGKVLLRGREVHPKSPQQMLALGIAYLSEDRDGQGLIMSESVVDNVTLPILTRLARLGVIDQNRCRSVAAEAVKTYDIRPQAIDKIVGELSGGNRQKVALARWLATQPVVLILDEPTHGVDVGSKSQIHAMILSLAAAGLAILMISSDLPEVIAMSDRILVVAEGRIVGEFDAAEATQERVMEAATRSAGVSDTSAARGPASHG